MRIETSGLRSAIPLLTAAVAFVSGISAASAGTGAPTPWEMGMQGMVTEVGRDLSNFHTWLVWLIAAICVFVLALIIIIAVRFNEAKNPVPSRTTHHTWLEVAWTIVPVLILIAIAIPSFRLLRLQLIIPPADVVVKATGYSWYWGYEYAADQGGGFKFDSNMVDAKDLKPGPAPPAHRRQRDGRAGEQGREGPGHRRPTCSIPSRSLRSASRSTPSPGA